MSTFAEHGRRPALAVIGAVLALASGLPAAPGAGADTPTARCAKSHFVASWTASPTDAVTPLDAAGVAVPSAVDDQTFRMVITPHLGGSQLRIHLSNQFGLTPVTFGHVTVGVRSAGAAAGDVRPVRFGGHSSALALVGGEVVSDPVALSFAAFTPLVVSIYVPAAAGPPTKHWNANATSYYSPLGSGDLTGRRAGDGFTATTNSWLYINALDVSAPADTRSIVAFGDSITDGFVAATAASVPVDRGIADTNGRYPDDLQRRLDRAGMALSVVNAGIGSNRVLTGGEPLLLGPSGIERFDRDALTQAGVGGVLVQEGINDLGLPPDADADHIIAGYQQLVAAAHRHGKKIWLGTLLPASNSIVDGVDIAPGSELNRQQINQWIRTQHLADGVVDFDAALRDPANPAVLNPAFGGPDHLHPNLAGYQAMADTVDLAMLNAARPTC